METLKPIVSDIDDTVLSPAWRCYEAGDYEGAHQLFKRILESGDKRNGYYGLGLVSSKKGDVVRAAKSLINAIKQDQNFHEAYLALGDIYSSVGQVMPAAENYCRAAIIAPDRIDYRQKLVHVLSAVALKKVNPNLKGVLTECLETDTIALPRFGKTWRSIATDDKGVSAVYKLHKHQNYPTFKKSMESFANLDGLMDQFFLLGFGKFIVPEQEFERWCLFLRRYLLEALAESKAVFSDPDYMDFIACALSRYCAFTDYVFSVTDEEKGIVERLKQRVENDEGCSLSELAMLGCYIPLYSLKNAKEIEQGLVGGDHVSQIPKSHIADYLVQQEIKKDIPVLGKIADQVSLNVQGQYEEFPYPRWDVAVQDIFTPEVEGHLKGKKAKILVAGCGTGQEAVQLSHVFPDAEITAVDLSATSLSYAIFKARQIGIQNINFMQGDILQLGELDQSFDYIASSGVLHHMDDPKAGWEVLRGLLKPDGLMRIALYSSQARWAINDARAVIAEKDIASDADSMRAFRDNISEHLKQKSIKNLASFYDYYSLPECRDLIFHVQEHQFDLLQIKDILDEFGLEFLRFHLSERDIQHYIKRHADDESATNLEMWAAWENKNPELFAAMYTFWCKPKAP